MLKLRKDIVVVCEKLVVTAVNAYKKQVISLAVLDQLRLFQRRLCLIICLVCVVQSKYILHVLLQTITPHLLLQRVKC